MVRLTACRMGKDYKRHGVVKLWTVAPCVDSTSANTLFDFGCF